MDEVGCGISEVSTEAEANCILVSFTDVQTGQGYCVVCLTRPVKEEERLLRWSEAAAREHQQGIAARLGLHGVERSPVTEVLSQSSPAAADNDAGAASGVDVTGGERGDERGSLLPVVRIGVCESICTNEHTSIMYKPFPKTRRKLASLSSGQYTPEYVRLDSADFPSGAADDPEVCAAAAAAIAARCDIMQGFSIGELIPWDISAAGVSSEARTHHVVAASTTS